MSGSPSVKNGAVEPEVTLVSGSGPVIPSTTKHQRRRSNQSAGSADTWGTLENFLSTEVNNAPGPASNTRSASLYPVVNAANASLYARSSRPATRGNATPVTEAPLEESAAENDPSIESDVESKGSGTTAKSKTSLSSSATAVAAGAAKVVVTDENGNPIPTENASMASTSMTSKEDAGEDAPQEKEYKTGLTMFLIGNMWIVHLLVICGMSWVMTMYLPQVSVGEASERASEREDCRSTFFSDICLSFLPLI